MLIPRFTIRAMFAVVAVSALVCLVLSLAVRGNQWAIGCTVGLFTLVTVFVVHGSFFGIAWLCSCYLERRKRRLKPSANIET